MEWNRIDVPVAARDAAQRTTDAVCGVATVFLVACIGYAFVSPPSSPGQLFVHVLAFVVPAYFVARYAVRRTEAAEAAKVFAPVYDRELWRFEAPRGAGTVEVGTFDAGINDAEWWRGVAPDEALELDEFVPFDPDRLASEEAAGTVPSPGDTIRADHADRMRALAVLLTVVARGHLRLEVQWQVTTRQNGPHLVRGRPFPAEVVLTVPEGDVPPGVAGAFVRAAREEPTLDGVLARAFREIAQAASATVSPAGYRASAASRGALRSLASNSRSANVVWSSFDGATT